MYALLLGADDEAVIRSWPIEMVVVLTFFRLGAEIEIQLIYSPNSLLCPHIHFLVHSGDSFSLIHMQCLLIDALKTIRYVNCRTCKQLFSLSAKKSFDR